MKPGSVSQIWPSIGLGPTLQNRDYFASVGGHTSDRLLKNIFVSTVSYHIYADDTHIYLALSPNDFGTLDSLGQSVKRIDSWMFHHFLQLKKDKTEVVVLEANEDSPLKSVIEV